MKIRHHFSHIAYTKKGGSIMYLTNDDFVPRALAILIGSGLIVLGIKLVLQNIKVLKGVFKKSGTTEKGFTLIELIIIMAIIGVLVTIAIPQFASYRIRGFDADTMSVLRTSALSQEAYYVDNSSYTSDVFVLLNKYNLETGEVMITQPMVVGWDSYHIEAKHPASPNRYELNGPGGTIALQ